MTATNRPRLLDLFCGVGGAGMGYHRAGFEVVGVDLVPQPRYPFTFIQGDALEYVRKHGREFDAIHASPPCQAYSVTASINSRHHEAPELIPVTRELLASLGRPYIIENVPGAPMLEPVVLCGQSFGIRVIRHRLFESPLQLTTPSHVKHTDFLPFLHRQERLYADAMGVTWATKVEARQSIPPIYTEYLGGQLRGSVLTHD